VTRTNRANESGTRRLKSQRIKRIGVAASGLAVVLACGATGTQWARPMNQVSSMWKVNSFP
jgi:hypothetical protein